MKRHKIAWFLLVLAAASSSVADELSSNGKKAFATSSTTGAPSAVGDSAPQVSVEAGIANTQAQIIWKNRAGVIFKLSAPESKSAESTDFTTLDGLANKLAFGVGYSNVFGTLTNLKPDAHALQVPICRKYGLVKKPGEAAEPNCNDGALEEHLKNEGRSQREIDEALGQFDAASFSGWLSGFSFEAKAGYKNFEYFDGEAEEQKEDKVSTSFSAAYLAIYGRGRIAFGLSAQRDFKDPLTKVQKCMANATNSALEECKELAFGPPNDDNELISRVEVRHIFGHWAISPTLSFNFDSDVWGIDAPIYFLRNGDGQFTGGFRVGWRSDKDEPVASIFVTKPLPLF